MPQLAVGNTARLVKPALSRRQKALVGIAGDAVVGQKVECPPARLDQGEPHRRGAFHAGHFDGDLEARAGRRRSWRVQHRILESPGGTQRFVGGPREPPNHYVIFSTSLESERGSTMRLDLKAEIAFLPAGRGGW